MAKIRKFTSKKMAHGLRVAILPMPDKSSRSYEYGPAGLVAVLRQWQADCEQMRGQRRCRISKFREVA